MHDGDTDDQIVGDQVERFEVVIECVTTLQADERRVLTARLCCLILRGIAYDLDVLWNGFEDALQATDIFNADERPAGAAPPRIGGNHPGRAADRRLSHARQVDLTVKASAKQP